MILGLVSFLVGLLDGGARTAVRPGIPRRGFLRRAALVATALATDPWGFILRPQTAYASVCGPANECTQGWTAFCCTINDGANTCPPGSYAAGWWKVSSSAFCRGEDRYVIDCNRLPEETCECHCADGPCDRRRVCCNNFRYGQCNQQIPGVTEVVCRVVICTPPWEWDETCTTTVRTDERTRDHSATCLNRENPTEIEVRYQDLGLVGSPLGARIGAEQDLPDGGSWQGYDHGVITRHPSEGLTVLSGPVAVVYRDRGGPTDWLGYPTSPVLSAPGGRSRIDFQAGWSLVGDGAGVRLLPADVEPPEEGWPETAAVTRWAGPDRIATAVEVARQTYPDGASFVVVAAGDALVDALAGGVLAGASGGPVLLTAAARLSAATRDELQRLDPADVVLSGGEAVLAAGVLADIRDALPEAHVRRVAGTDRYATAVALAEVLLEDVEPPPSAVYVASGRSIADALAAGPIAAVGGTVLLLTEPDRLPEVTADALAAVEPDVVRVLGGEGVVAAEVEEQVVDVVDAQVHRIAGPSRYDTATQLTRLLGPEAPDRVIIASGDSLVDALAAGAAAAAIGAALLLTTDTDLPAVTRTSLAELGPEEVVLIGGTAAASEVVAEQLAATPVQPLPPRAETADPPALPGG